jgi:AcrR family transcriptional regulator
MAAPAEARALAAPTGAYKQLRPRRNGPGPQAVARHQRARLYAAMIDTVAERGYAATTVTELRRRAGVSKRTIYDQFANKETFFLTTYDLVVLRTIKRVSAAYRNERDPDKRLSRAFEVFVREVLTQPDAARLALVEARGAGPAALARTERANRTFEQMVITSFQHAPDGVVIPRIIVTGIVGGIARSMRLRLLDGGIHQIPGLAEELLEWALLYRSGLAHELRTGHCREPVADRRSCSATMPAEPDGREGDRRRILRSAMRLAAIHGYENLTVASILEESQASDEIFFDLFHDSQQCFMQALDDGVKEALAAVRAACVDREDWVAAVHGGMAALLRYLALDLHFARNAFVEALAVGPDAIKSSEAFTEAAMRLFEDLRPAGERPSEQVSQAIVGALWEVIHHYVLRGATSRLPELTEHATYLVLAPLIGPAGAMAGITAQRVKAESLVCQPV